MQTLLVQKSEMRDHLSKDVKISDYTCRRLELMRNDLSMRFKEKMLQWMIQKEMHKENEQASLNESSC